MHGDQKSLQIGVPHAESCCEGLQGLPGVTLRHLHSIVVGRLHSVIEGGARNMYIIVYIQVCRDKPDSFGGRIVCGL